MRNLLSRLKQVQQANDGWLSRPILEGLSRSTGESLSRLQELVSFYPHLRTEAQPAVRIQVCRDMSCHLNGAEGLAARLAAALGPAVDLVVEEVSCLGYCDLAPAVQVNGAPVCISDLEPFVALVAAGTVEGSPAARRALAMDPYADPAARYGAARDVLARFDQEAGRDSVISWVKDAGLRGMGGAGFPTGRKWELVRSAPGTTRYVVCNADESEPGTFKDRAILEQAPHLVIEGMLLDAFAVGARKGFIYLRHEYEGARRALEAELTRARTAGYLGCNVFGVGLDFDIELFVSAGGYVLGEETALLEALEGKRGEPRNKPPFPGQSGLWGCPTLINNVETLAWAPAICLRGPEWWRGQGVGEREGRKVVSVSGHVERPGVFEIPLGTTVAEVLEMAGGVAGGRRLKAFSPGGASSGLLPASMVDTPIDFGSFEKLGSMLGSGGLVFIAEGTGMLPLAANLLRFFRDESCGKCVPCRVGTEKGLALVQRALDTGAPIHRPTLERLRDLLAEASICGLGQIALAPLFSIMEHWPEEVPLIEGSCGAGRPPAGGGEEAQP